MSEEKSGFVNEFFCCKNTFAPAEFIEHLTKVHGFVKGTQARRSLVMAVDGARFSNHFEWEIPCGDKTITVQQICAGPRNAKLLAAIDRKR